jgi:hypothetical protein
MTFPHLTHRIAGVRLTGVKWGPSAAWASRGSTVRRLRYLQVVLASRRDRRPDVPKPPGPLLSSTMTSSPSFAVRGTDLRR